MKKSVEEIGGLKKIVYEPYVDKRGGINKIYRSEIFDDLIPQVSEIYVSTSAKNTVRGLHYQHGLHGQDKLIYCVSGSILDITVNLMPGPEYGTVNCVPLDAIEPIALLVPKYFAHGVISLEADSVFVSLNSEKYSPGNERGIRWNSLGLDINISDPIISEKDMAWPLLVDVLKEVAV